jgi:hypothetical protein
VGVWYDPVCSRCRSPIPVDYPLHQLLLNHRAQFQQVDYLLAVASTPPLLYSLDNVAKHFTGNDEAALALKRLYQKCIMVAMCKWNKPNHDGAVSKDTLLARILATMLSGPDWAYFAPRPAPAVPQAAAAVVAPAHTTGPPHG